MLNILVQLLSYLTAAGIPFLMLAGGMKPHFYYPLYALPILSLSYFSGPLSTAGMFVISLLVGIGGFIFSVGDIQYGIPFLFLLQMGWLWLLFWLAGRMIERKDMEIHHLQEKIEKLEVQASEYRQKKKGLENSCHGLKERIARYTQLRAFTDELAASLQIKDVQTMVGSSLLKLFGGEKDAQASLHLFDSPNNPAKDDAVGQWLTKYRIPLWIQDFSQDQRFFQDPADRRGSLLSAPIERENGVIGSLILESPQTRLWDEEDRRFLADISSLVSLSVSNAVYYEKVESLAVKDALTGLYARYRFDEKIEEEFFRSRKSGSPLSLIFFDIDLFKRVNDSWGHNVGDEVLKSVAAFVMGQTRETDFCARYGGEEIVVLMPLTTLENASQIADRIRQRVAAHPIGFEQIPVTISGGVSSLTASMDTPLSLLQSADQSLYKAKGSGRNRIVTS